MSPDSGDSQFFICFDGCSHLTGQYTVWGQVISGMEAVENLAVGEPSSNPDKMISVKLAKNKIKFTTLIEFVEPIFQKACLQPQLLYHLLLQNF